MRQIGDPLPVDGEPPSALHDDDDARRSVGMAVQPGERAIQCAFCPLRSLRRVAAGSRAIPPEASPGPVPSAAAATSATAAGRKICTTRMRSNHICARRCERPDVDFDKIVFAKGRLFGLFTKRSCHHLGVTRHPRSLTQPSV